MNGDAADQKENLLIPENGKLWKEAASSSRGYEAIARSVNFHEIGSGAAKPRAQTISNLRYGTIARC
jgi:hypothetical protein